MATNWSSLFYSEGPSDLNWQSHGQDVKITKRFCFCKFCFIKTIFRENFSVTSLLSTVQIYSMAARGKQRQASKPYNLRTRVGIPIEIQAEDDGTFVNEFLSKQNVGQVPWSLESSDNDTCLDEFASQPSAGQVLLSSESSDTDTSSTDWNSVFQKSIAGSDCSDSQTEVKRFKPRSSEWDTAVHQGIASSGRSDLQTKVKRFKPRSSGSISQSRRKSDASDQACINERILSQLDAINERLNAIENPEPASVSVSKLHAAPRGKKRLVKTASSSLKLSGHKSGKNSHEKMPDLKSIRQDNFIQQQVEERIKQLAGSDKKGTEKSSHLGAGKLTFTSNNASNGHMNMFWLGIIKIVLITTS